MIRSERVSETGPKRLLATLVVVLFASTLSGCEWRGTGSATLTPLSTEPSSTATPDPDDKAKLRVTSISPATGGDRSVYTAVGSFSRPSDPSGPQAFTFRNYISKTNSAPSALVGPVGAVNVAKAIANAVPATQRQQFAAATVDADACMPILAQYSTSTERNAGMMVGFVAHDVDQGADFVLFFLLRGSLTEAIARILLAAATSTPLVSDYTFLGTATPTYSLDSDQGLSSCYLLGQVLLGGGYATVLPLL